MRQHLLPLLRKHGKSIWVFMSRENVPDACHRALRRLGVTGWYGHRKRTSSPTARTGTRDDCDRTHLSRHEGLLWNHPAVRQEGPSRTSRSTCRRANPKRIAITSRHNQHGGRPHAEAQGVPARRARSGVPAASSRPSRSSWTTSPSKRPRRCDPDGGRAWRPTRILQRAFSTGHNARQNDPEGRALLDHGGRKRQNFEFDFRRAWICSATVTGRSVDG